MKSKREEIEEAMRQAALEARAEQTPAEKALWAMVRAHRCGGLHFRRQWRLGPFRVDFYCAALGLSIEIDGGIHDAPDVQRRDAERQAILEQEFGLRFLRVSNEDVLKRPKQTRRRILSLAPLTQ